MNDMMRLAWIICPPISERVRRTLADGARPEPTQSPEAYVPETIAAGSQDEPCEAAQLWRPLLVQGAKGLLRAVVDVVEAYVA